MQFRLLGSVEVLRSDGSPRVSGKPLALLACLLLHANSVVALDTIVDALWDEDDLPAEGKAAVQTCVLRLRRALGPEAVETVGSGYRMTASAETLDVLAFADLTRRADDATARGQHAEAAQLLHDAIELWRGPALLGVASPTLQRDHVPALAERLVSTWEAWADAELALGRSPVPELTRLTAEHPLRERFWAQLMTALHRAGRTADALAAYRQVASTLADELGLDPGPELRQAHQSVLEGAETASTAPAPPNRPPAVVPRELSAAPETFVGREDELARLEPLVRSAAGSTVTVIVIEGTAGVGKTAIVLRAANEHADAFPAGQIQLNLHGFGPDDPMAPADALESLLGSLGVSGRQLPPSVEARSALWRTTSAGRRLLVVLDNARNSEQVRPLLPGAECVVLVTSRSQLRSLTARDSAHRINVDRLDEEAALDLLGRGVGGPRVAADASAARRLVTYCARLPLAIRIAGEHANQRPDVSLAQFVAELDDEVGRLDALDLGDGEDTDLRAVFDHSYAALEPDTAIMLRMLGAVPGVTIGLAEAAVAAGQTQSGARRLVDRLVGAHLLGRTRGERFEFHDLLREYAAEQARRTGDADTALRRLIEWYVFAGVRAANALGDVWGDDPNAPESLVLPAFAGFDEAYSWFDEHRANLVAGVGAAHHAGQHWHAARLALVLHRFFNAAQVQEGWVASCRLGLDAARALGDRRTEGRLLTSFGVALACFGGSGDEAVDSHRAALAIAQEVDRPEDEFAALTNLDLTLLLRGDVDAALDCARQALAAAQRIGSRRRIVKGHTNYSDALIAAGRHAEAREHAHAALELCDPDGDPLAWAGARLNLATAQAATGRRVEAMEGFQLAARRLHDVHQHVAEAEAYEKLGDLYRDEGDQEQGLANLRIAHELLAPTGHVDTPRLAAKLRALSEAVIPSA